MSLDPRHDDRPRLCRVCEAQDAALDHGDLCIEHWLENLVSNDQINEALFVAYDHDVPSIAVYDLVEAESKQRDLCLAMKSGALRGQVAS